MSFLQRYVDRHSSLECAESFHVFSWLAVVSACLGRKVWLERGGFFTTWPNIYVALIGEAGCGKSVAMFQARNLVQEELNPHLPKEDRIVLAPKCSSARRFMSVISSQQSVFKWGERSITHAPIFCCLSELSNFIQLDPHFTLNFLTDSYDDKYFTYETEHKGSISIEGPAPVVLACTTHKYISEKLREDVITDGGSRRFFWVLDERSEHRNAFPEKPQVDPEIVSRLIAMRKLVGPFEWSDECKEMYKDWYNANDRKNYGMDGYGTTKNVKVEKLAMILAASERLELVLRPADITKALELCTMMERNLAKVFAGVGRNELSTVANSLVEMIHREGGRLPETKARLFLYRQVNTREFEEIVAHLIKSNVISKHNGILILTPEQVAGAFPSPSAMRLHPNRDRHGAAHPPAGNGSLPVSEML